jgi:hypothetical protein
MPPLYIPLDAAAARLGRPVYVVTEVLVEPQEGMPPAPQDLAQALILVATPPTAVHLLAMPPELPGVPCYLALTPEDQHAARIRSERWLDRFLAAALHAPLSIVEHMGRDRTPLAMALLRAWSWIPEADGTFPFLPSEAMMDMLRLLAAKTRRLPSDLAKIPVHEFVLNYRVLLPKKDGTPDPSGLEELYGG